jgi:hypothetical protein
MGLFVKKTYGFWALSFNDMLDKVSLRNFSYMMFEAFGFMQEGPCGAENNLSYLRRSCFGGALRFV